MHYKNRQMTFFLLKKEIIILTYKNIYRKLKQNERIITT